MAEVSLDRVTLSAIVMTAALLGMVELSAEMDGALVQISSLSIHQITASPPEMLDVLLERDWTSTVETAETTLLEMSGRLPMTVKTRNIG